MLNKDPLEQAVAVAKEKFDLIPVYMDTETTGIEDDAEIVEIALIDANGDVLFDSLVKPVGPIGLEAAAVHHITEEMVSQAPSWAEVWPEVEKILKGQALGIYNADFDVRMMIQSHQKHSMPWNPPYAEAFCLMKLYAQYYGDWNSSRNNYRWQSLEKAARQCNIPLPNSHRAKDDTLLTRALHLYMMGKWPE
jgi:DNA polymerase-3 subunit epsilon